MARRYITAVKAAKVGAHRMNVEFMAKHRATKRIDKAASKAISAAISQRGYDAEGIAEVFEEGKMVYRIFDAMQELGMGRDVIHAVIDDLFAVFKAEETAAGMDMTKRDKADGIAYWKGRAA